MSEVKQIIVVRKDIHMRSGKMAAQVAHASMKVLLDLLTEDDSLLNHTTRYILLRHGSPLSQWLDGQFTKVVVYVNSEAELFMLRDMAGTDGIRHALITDAGRTEFHGEPTNTALAIGPDYSEKIDKITGGLPLL